MSAASPVRPPDTTAIVGRAIRSSRRATGGKLSRRTLHRRTLGLRAAVWVTELLAGTIGFLWSAGASAASRVRVGTRQDLIALNPGLPIAEGFPAYVAEARAFVVLLDPSRHAFVPGVDPTGDGTALNVRALSQICPHLGCRPNPCVEDRWFHCPCHQLRYDRRGIKPAGTRYGPADRSMDRFSIEVDDTGVLTIDTRRVSLGPLPVSLGQPGVEPPLVQNGCT